MITLRLDPLSAAPAYHYRVAGVPLRADRELAWLSSLASPAAPGDDALEALAASGAQAAAPGEVLFADTAFLARRERRVSCRRIPEGFLFEAEGLGLFRYCEAASRLEVAAAAPEASPELLAEVLLGPLLALALARRDVFLLHASACEIGGATWLFLGESGAGKSTLAARLAELGGVLLADDQAAIGALRLELLPDFPQPKLGPLRQAPLAAVPARHVDGIFLLEKAPAGEEPALADLSPMVAAAGLLRHTTAARCFDFPLLRAHLDFAAALVARVPCRRLRYPHGEDAPKKIGALLAHC